MKYFIFAIIAGICFNSCLKTSTNVSCPYTNSTTIASATEIATLQTYINANHPNAVKDASGMFYEISTTGTGTVSPTVCSNVTVNYTGTLTNGIGFDSSKTGFSSLLGALIVGWQKGLPLIKKGGSITLYIPPTLGYGNQIVYDKYGAVLIPANSNLIFNIQLLDVQ